MTTGIVIKHDCGSNNAVVERSDGQTFRLLPGGAVNLNIWGNITVGIREERQEEAPVPLPQDTAPEEPIVKYFAYTHLPPKLQEVSAPFSLLATSILKLPRSAERTVALRKLLESKDAAVRASL
jgi:hypothetical protein